MEMAKFGKWAFLVVLILAIGVPLLNLLSVDPIVSATTISIVLVLASLVVGFLNISEDESTGFMLAVLVIGFGAGVLAVLPLLGAFLDEVMINLAAASIPAGLVVAVKTVVAKANG